MADELAHLEELMREAFTQVPENHKLQPALRSSRGPFIYSPLNNHGCIRLIKLSAGHTSAPLRANLIEVALEHLPHYDALSYCWGDPKRSHIIFLDGFHLAVTESLFQALVRLRFTTTAHLLWVDALCIDQTNDSEKSSQVLLMPKIYARAKQVICWLGEDDDRESAWGTVQLMKKIGEINFDHPAAARDKEAWRVSHGLPPRRSQHWFRFIEFWARPYFRRRWTIQEIVFANDAVIAIGDKQEPWRNLISGVEKVLGQYLLEQILESYRMEHPIEVKRQLANGALQIFQAVKSIKSEKWEKGDIVKMIQWMLTGEDGDLANTPVGEGLRIGYLKPMEWFYQWIASMSTDVLSDLSPDEVQGMTEHVLQSIEPLAQPLGETGLPGRDRLPQLLTLFDSSDASDPRDRLFALLSLSSDRDNSLLKPDYNQSPATVLMRYASVFIEEGIQGLAVLRSAGLSYRAASKRSPLTGSINSLPSWVPDWISPHREKPMVLGIFELWSMTGPIKYCAGGSTKPSLRLLADGQTLLARGSIIDTVSTVIVGLPLEGSGIIREVVEYWEKADALMAEKYPSYPFLKLGPERETMAELQRVTLIANYSTSPHRSQEGWESSYSEFRAYNKHLNDLMALYDAGVLSQDELTQALQNTRRDEIPEILEDYHNRATMMSLTHDLVGTKRGLVGMVPRGVAIGDSIAVLCGASTPSIIRPVEVNAGILPKPASPFYNLVSGAYMHGIMRGEVVSSDWWKEEDITIV